MRVIFLMLVCVPCLAQVGPRAQFYYSGGTTSGATCVSPSISVQPQNAAVLTNTTATFTVSASGTAPLSYQWSWYGTNVAGATLSSFSPSDTSIGEDGSTVAVGVTNSCGGVLSSSATLTVTNGVALSPTDIPGAVLFLSYADYATNATGITTWTNQLASSLVYSSSVATTNSSSGFAFTDDSIVFTKSGSGIGMNLETNSIWVCFTPTTSTTDTYNVILGAQASGGAGLYLNVPGNSFRWYTSGGAGQFDFGAGWSYSSQYDIALFSTNSSGTSLIFTTTNGVSSGLSSGIVSLTEANAQLYGISVDNGGDYHARMRVKFVLVCANHAFTPTEIQGLHTYAVSH